MRVDAKKNLKKVAIEVLKDPLASSQKLADRAGVSRQTVDNKLAQLGNVERTSAVVAICDTDLEIVQLTQSINLERLQDPEERAKIKALDLANIAKISQERHTKLMGDNVNKNGGEKQINIINYGDNSSTPL